MTDSTADRDPFRPIDLNAFVGQERLKREIRVVTNSARMRNEPLGHLMLVGRPGCGKTTIAKIIADMVGDPFREHQASLSLETLGEILQSFHGVLLLDEIHTLAKKCQEALKTMLVAGYLDLPGYRVTNEWVSIIGATNHEDRLDDAFRDRFRFFRYRDYVVDELALIAKGMALRVGLELSDDMTVKLGQAAFGSPRQVQHLVENARDLALDLHRPPSLEELLEYSGTDQNGVTERHAEYLDMLARLNGQSGQKTLASLLRVSPAMLDEIERLLLYRGLIRVGRGNQGRMLTDAGRALVRVLRGEPETPNPRRRAA